MRWRYAAPGLREPAVARLVVPGLDRLDAVHERLFELALADRAEHELEQPSLRVLALADDDVVDVGRPVGMAREGVRVEPRVGAMVPAVEEHHGAAAEHLVGVLSGILEDLLHGPRASGGEDDPGSGDGQQPVLADAVGEVLRDVRGELTDRLALRHPRRDGEALAARREPLPDPNRDLEVAGLVRGIARRLRECPHGVVARVQPLLLHDVGTVDVVQEVLES